MRRFVAERSPLSKLRELMASGQPYDAGRVEAAVRPARAGRPDHPGGARRRRRRATRRCPSRSSELGAGLVAVAAARLHARRRARCCGSATRRPEAGCCPASPAASSSRPWPRRPAPAPARADGDALTGEISPGAQRRAGRRAARARRPTGRPRRCCSRSTPRRAGLTGHAAARARSQPLAGPGPAGRHAGPRPGRRRGRGARLRGQDLANLALASEQLGAMAACLAMTTEYAKIRIAFGRPIGAFQGVKHRLAELGTTWELAHAALRDAARAADERPGRLPARRRRSRGCWCRPATSTPRSHRPAARRHRLHLGARRAPVLQERHVAAGAVRRRPTSSSTG